MALTADDPTPILMSKVNIKDGYWQMVVNEEDAWNFAYVLPPENDLEEVVLVIPNALQMGWSKSLPFFCAATETGRDVAQFLFDSNANLPPHPLEKNMLDIDWTKYKPQPSER